MKIPVSKSNRMGKHRMNAVVIPDVRSGDPTRYISRVAKLIPIHQMYTLRDRSTCNVRAELCVQTKLTKAAHQRF